MPRAENRKRPPNLRAQTSGGSKKMNGDMHLYSSDVDHVQQKKRELLEKIRNIQQTKKY